MTHPDIEAMAQELWGSSIGGEHYHYNEIDAYTKQPHWKKKIPEALAAWSLALSRLREPSETETWSAHEERKRWLDAKARELGIGEG